LDYAYTQYLRGSVYSSLADFREDGRCLEKAIESFYEAILIDKNDMIKNRIAEIEKEFRK
jgi:hypothetical protein